MAEIDQSRQRNRDWTKRFIAAGCDPRALPDAEEEQFQGVAYGNPDQVVADADLIVVAHVATTSFDIGGDADTPFARSSLTILDAIKGGEGASTLQVNQYGGPVRDRNWGVLAHPIGMPVLLAGDDAILFLKRFTASDGKASYSPLSYVGTYYIREGLVYADDANPCAWAIAGTPLQRFTDFIKSVIVRTASASISSAPSCGDFSGASSSTPTTAATPNP